MKKANSTKKKRRKESRKAEFKPVRRHALNEPVEPDPASEPWISAIYRIDNKHADTTLKGKEKRVAENERKADLLALLRSKDVLLPPLARFYLADLLERSKLSVGRRMPAYKMSNQHSRLEAAARQVRGKRGKEREECFESAWRTHHVEPHDLDAYLDDKKSDIRRRKKRLPTSI